MGTEDIIAKTSFEEEVQTERGGDREWFLTDSIDALMS